MTFRKFRNNKVKNSFVDPDEIFLDSKNFQNFNRQQFEGRIEKPIPRRTINFLGIFFLCVILIFSGRLINLQAQNGEAYKKRSESNTLRRVNIFTERGIIYDRNRMELAWNEKQENDAGNLSTLYTRAYLSPGFSHTLGYVSYPKKDNAGYYWQTEFEGVNGLEKEYQQVIRGENGSKIIEIDARGKVQSQNIVNMPERGSDLVTSIDSRIQKELFGFIQSLSESNNFTGGAGVIMNTQNGEIIAATSFPEYNAEILSLGKDSSAINSYLNDKKKVFLNRATSGLYTPGSIVKPFLALGALSETIIDPYKKILSTGSISIPNPYFPDQPTIFKDWKAHGWTDMAGALAVSSDIYFYSIGGGYEDQKGLGIANIEKYTTLFGFGEKTGIDLPGEIQGVIPNPEWKIKNFAGDPWRLGNTYHTSIGQYGFQVTPIEITRAISAIANRGKLVTPHFILDDKKGEEKIEILNVQKKHYDVIHNGMRQAVTYGTAVGLNVPYVEVVAKTGTAELGAAKNRINSWVIGFFPYKNPKYAFTVIMESGPAAATTNATSVMRKLLDWMSLNTPEYFETPPEPSP